MIADRTRREVIKKLRDLGLEFKKPTRKSTLQGQPKRTWDPEQDSKLSELYQEHRFDEGNAVIAHYILQLLKTEFSYIEKNVINF